MTESNPPRRSCWNLEAEPIRRDNSHHCRQLHPAVGPEWLHGFNFHQRVGMPISPQAIGLRTDNRPRPPDCLLRIRSATPEPGPARGGSGTSRVYGQYAGPVRPCPRRTSSRAFRHLIAVSVPMQTALCTVPSTQCASDVADGWAMTWRNSPKCCSGKSGIPCSWPLRGST